MTLAQLNTLLLTLHLPVAYDHFSEPTASPYIVYHFLNDNNFNADNKTYIKVNHIMVELYTETKNTATEALLEALLDDYVYVKSEDYLTDDNLFVIYYEIESEE